MFGVVCVVPCALSPSAQFCLSATDFNPWNLCPRGPSPLWARASAPTSPAPSSTCAASGSVSSPANTTTWGVSRSILRSNRSHEEERRCRRRVGLSRISQSHPKRPPTHPLHLQRASSSGSSRRRSSSRASTTSTAGEASSSSGSARRCWATRPRTSNTSSRTRPTTTGSWSVMTLVVSPACQRACAPACLLACLPALPTTNPGLGLTFTIEIDGPPQGSCEPLPDYWAGTAPFLVTANYAGPNSEEGFRRCTNRTFPEEAFRRLDQGAGAGLAGAAASIAGAAAGRRPNEVCDPGTDPCLAYHRRG
jgi:hypothetical protein